MTNHVVISHNDNLLSEIIWLVLEKTVEKLIFVPAYITKTTDREIL